MNKIAINIKNRLSLRQPQEESLRILAELTEILTLEKNADLNQELAKVNKLYPTCTEFERNFPSICFSLATGVGKTRLMGAFISYLHIHKGINNFFVLSPNLTIYNKLKVDLSEQNHPKYVFKGLSEFVHNKPRIITGDDYDKQLAGQMSFNSDTNINIFNISKIDAESKGGKVPLIKRLSEYIGYSYFEYLSSIKDLVLIMDESHHYRADRAMEVLNELNPILGLELTATPQVEKSGKSIKFKNVVYEYSLAKAIRDGFVKQPAVATREDFNPEKYSVDELDKIKLEDGIRIHEETKVQLDIYSRNNNVPQVKPFVLVVASKIEHAKKIKELIMSDEFFYGYYKDKVLQVDSTPCGEEKDENIEKLVSLENPSNNIEIVIHVNMLKEGWDVTNLYTIIPLRTAASSTLREQTIGRGLRLPYGTRTYNEYADRLTIVSHDKFQEIVDEANKLDSLIKRENIIVLNERELNNTKEVFVSTSVLENMLNSQNEAKKAICTACFKEDNHSSLDKLDKETTIEYAINSITTPENRNKQSIIEEISTTFDSVVKEISDKIIQIPKMSIIQSQPKSGFKNFDLDTKHLNFQPSSETIIVRTLTDGKSFTIETGCGKVRYDSIQNIILNEIINYPEVDYDEQYELLFKLTNQAIAKFRSYLPEDKIVNVIHSKRKEISEFIYGQMMQNFYCEPVEYEDVFSRAVCRFFS